jgi:hypothetical protein
LLVLSCYAPALSLSLSRNLCFAPSPSIVRFGDGLTLGLSARKIAAALNERKIATPTGGVWHAATVIRVQKRFGLAHVNAERKIRTHR